MRTCMILLAAAAAAVVVAVAGASGGQRWADPRGDAATAPDITDVAVTSDDAGTITFTVAVANRTALEPDDELDVGLDADRLLATGHNGLDYVVGVYDGSKQFVLRWSDADEDWVDVPAPSYRYAWDNGTATYTINRSDLGWTPGFEFYAVGWTGADELSDFAPSGDDRWSYSLALPFALRIAPATMYDVTDASARSGRSFTLAARVIRDDTGETVGSGKVGCTATLAGRKLAVSTKGGFFRITVSNGGGDLTQALCTWKLPKTAKGKVLKAGLTVSLSGRSVARTFTGKVK